MARVRETSGNYPNGLSGATGFKDDTSGNKDRVGRTVAVTASDTVDLPNGTCEGLIVTTAGAYKLTYDNGLTDSPYLAAGIEHPIRAKRVWSTGSVATTGISAIY